MRTAYCPKCKDDKRFYTDYGKGHSWIRICTDCDNDISFNYKLCILGAGRGTRSKEVKGLHKAFLPVENRPVISHVIEKFDKSIEIVIATGYKSEQIKSYLDSVHTDRKITYVDVDNFDGPNSGPGYSLLSCEEELQCPFIYTTVDTIVDTIDDSDIFDFVGENWIGASNIGIGESVNYCLIKGEEYLSDLYYGKGDRAYIGLAGISDYRDFWKSLKNKNNGSIIHKDDLHEYQADYGFRGLDKIKIIDFKWYDTGNSISYAKVKEVFSNDVVANKSDEAIFIDNNKVVKYFSDENKVKTRLKRINYLNDTCPKVHSINKNMYSYDYIEGKLLSEVDDANVFNDFLNYYQTNFINKGEKTASFLKDCEEMYESKTISRLSKMKDTDLDKIKIINGVEVDSIQNLIDRIDWKDIYSKSISSRFHGDLQLENILYSNGKFVLIDWRESFGGSQIVGDLYYDLGKLWHSLPVNGKTILREIYEINYKGETADIEYYFKSNLLEFYFVFKRFCKENGYDWEIVKLSGILHYLNICTLYNNFQNGRYGEFLFLLGKLLLTKHLNGEDIV